MMPRLVIVLPGCKDRLETTVSLLTKYNNNDHFAYERGDVWHVGLGNYASLRVDPTGQTALVERQGKQEVHEVTSSLTDVARDFTSEQSAKHDGKMFGQVGFNYGAHVRGQSFTPGRWDILSIIVPVTEIILKTDQIIVHGHDEQQMAEVCSFLKGSAMTAVHVGAPRPVDTQQNEQEYKTLVTNALSEITAGDYTKVIVSRAIDLHQRVDMQATLLHGRRSNTPARCFTMNHAGFQATGFSPELVMSAQNGTVLTEPLAGTRYRIGKPEEVEKLRQTLMNDEKEIVEQYVFSFPIHFFSTLIFIFDLSLSAALRDTSITFCDLVISVKEAIKELNSLCDTETVNVKELMVIKERGSVQHLASTVLGQLPPKADSWSALSVLFPSITASGIPKNLALDAIGRLETRPRELYSGAVMLIDGRQDFLEAILCLRTVFQDPDKTWIQAGARIISQSNPERELTETAEKFANVAPFIVYQ